MGIANQLLKRSTVHGMALGVALALPSATALGISPVAAISFGASIEQSRWQVQSSEVECQMVQAIPGFGDGVFSHRAGGHFGFYLKPFNPVLRPGPAQIVIESPGWKHAPAPAEIATVEITDDYVPLELEPGHADSMLESLRQGLQPVIASDSQRPVKIALSAANFQAPYSKYMDCLAQLLPVDFEHIARSAIFFKNNKSRLSDSVEGQLDLIARYVKADDRVQRIYVDGHTDDKGAKRLNINLSKARAAAVTDYFRKAGVKKKIIVSRHHADKYPALKNDSAENRARNRRVTIRLERD